MDWKLELVAIPVTDELRFVPLTPPGSACSITIGIDVTDAAPGSVPGMQLVVADINAAHATLSERGVDVSEIQQFPVGRLRLLRRPDGNRQRAADRDEYCEQRAERLLTDILRLSSPEAHHGAARKSDSRRRVHGAGHETVGDVESRHQVHGLANSRGTRVRTRAAGVPRQSRVAPGAAGTVTASSPDGTTTVEIAGQRVGIGAFASQRILTTAGR